MIDDPIWLEFKQKTDVEMDEALTDPENIRYYLGKYKVCILPKQKDGLFKGYRTVFALETFPHNGIQMMINPREQFSTSTRHLHRVPANKLTREKP